MEAQQQRIRIYFFGHEPERPVSALAGALGVGPLPRPGGIEASRYDRLAKTAPRRFEIVASDSADLWVYAHEVTERGEISAQLARLPPNRGRCVFFYSADDASPLTLDQPNVTVYRTSLFGRNRRAYERGMPALCDDVLASADGRLLERPWAVVPSVGFCGFVGSPLKRLGFLALGRQEKSSGLVLRDRALAALESTPQVHTRFIRRTSFWGGSMGRFHFDAARQAKVRSEFIDNLFGTDYGLCVRGKGNFSYRLYEVLSAGRIPVFINSDCVLPFEGQIDWRRHMVWLEPEQLSEAGSEIRRFHQRLGPEGFRELQHENRSLWEQWLSPESFFERALQEPEVC